MRLLPLLALPFLTSVALAADSNDRGPGIAGERHGDAVRYAAAQFDKIGYGMPGSIDVRVGPAWSVQATGPAAAFANLRVTVDRNGLAIEHRYRDRPVDRDAERQLHFTVTLPRLAAVGLGGSGRMSVDRVRGDTLDAAVGGSGSLSLGEIAVDRARISIGGSGDISARGTARELNVSLGGSGRLQAPDLRAARAEVTSAGSGSVRATVDGPARVSAIGSGSVDLGPRAHCAVTRMGKATVRCG